jgi:hypothetical protein
MLYDQSVIPTSSQRLSAAQGLRWTDYQKPDFFAGSEILTCLFVKRVSILFRAKMRGGKYPSECPVVENDKRKSGIRNV